MREREHDRLKFQCHAVSSAPETLGEIVEFSIEVSFVLEFNWSDLVLSYLSSPQLLKVSNIKEQRKELEKRK